MASSVQGSEEYVENACCVCLKKNRRKDADKYCIQCIDYFCSFCEENVHAMIPANAEHTLLGKSDFKSLFGSKKESLPNLPTQRCGQHRSKVLELYCADHDEVVCSSCVALEHRPCREVKSIPENIKNLYSKVKIGDTKKRVSSVIKSLEDILRGHNEDVKKLNNSYEKVREEVEAFHKKLRENLRAAKQETLTQLQDDYKRKEAKITEEINESKHLLQSLEKLMLELGKMEGNQAQEFVQIKTCEKMVAKREELQKKQQKQSSSIIISFTADSDIKAYFQQIKVLGWVATGPVSKTLVSEVKPPKHREEVQQDLSPAPVAKTYASKAKPSESKAELFTPKTSLYKVTETTDINVRLQGDEMCFIWGSCLTENGCLLLTDNWNCKLQRVDLSTQKVRDYLTLNAKPRDVCSVSRKEVAVCLDNNTVQFFSVAAKMTYTRTLTFDHDCWGIAHHNRRLFISDFVKSVYIHDMKGKKLREISTDASGKDIFQDTKHIAVGGAGDRMYVAGEKGLVTLDIDGNYLSTLSDEDMQVTGACGVCTDGRNVFVGGYMSANVVQIGQDNTPLGQTANVKAPLSLCFDSQTKTLYVTGCDDHVTVLQLK